MEESLTGRSAIHERVTASHPCAVKLIVVTDCKNLYDAALSENPAGDEKRVLIHILALRETLQHGSLRWVPAHLQFSDSLTRLSDKLRRDMLEWLKHPFVQLSGDLSQRKRLECEKPYTKH